MDAKAPKAGTQPDATGPVSIDEWAQAMADLPHDRDGHLALAGQVVWERVEAAFEATVTA